MVSLWSRKLAFCLVIVCEVYGDLKLCLMTCKIQGKRLISSLSEQWFFRSCEIHKHVFLSTPISCTTCLYFLLFVPHSCSPFSACASHHHHVSGVGSLPNDPLPFPVTANCPIPADFSLSTPDYWAHLIRGPILGFPSDSQGSLLCSLSKAPTRHSFSMEKHLFL